eukprot:10412149-Heterocapsa_arctica.AAC.1
MPQLQRMLSSVASCECLELPPSAASCCSCHLDAGPRGSCLGAASSALLGWLVVQCASDDLKGDQEFAPLVSQFLSYF